MSEAFHWLRIEIDMINTTLHMRTQQNVGVLRERPDTSILSYDADTILGSKELTTKVDTTCTIS